MALTEITPSGAIKETLAGGNLALLYDSGALGSTAATIDSGAGGFSTNFNLLTIYYALRSDTAAVQTTLKLRFNNDSGTNYSNQGFAYNAGVSGTRGNVYSQTEVILNDALPAASAPAGMNGTGNISVPMYSGVTFHKEFYFVSGDSTSNASGGENLYHGTARWASTSAINRVTLLPGAGNFVAGSRVLIYGQ